jgi:hypothetical protein
MMTKDEIVLKTAITSDEIDRCISILAQLNSNTDEIFDIEKKNGLDQSCRNVFETRSRRTFPTKKTED